MLSPIPGGPSHLLSPFYFSLTILNLLRKLTNHTKTFKIRKKYAIRVLCHALRSINLALYGAIQILVLARYSKDHRQQKSKVTLEKVTPDATEINSVKEIHVKAL